MDFKVFLSAQALIDLERIIVYITFDNAEAAERMGHQLLNAALSSTTFRRRGRMVPEFGRQEIREIVFRSYRIIYRVNETLAFANRWAAWDPILTTRSYGTR